MLFTSKNEKCRGDQQILHLIKAHARCEWRRAALHAHCGTQAFTLFEDEKTITHRRYLLLQVGRCLAVTWPRSPCSAVILANAKPIHIMRKINKFPYHFFPILGDAHGSSPEGICVNAGAVLYPGLMHNFLVDGGCCGLQELLLLASVHCVEVRGREHDAVSLWVNEGWI